MLIIHVCHAWLNLHACKCQTRQAKETYVVALVDNDSTASMRSVDPRGYRTIISFGVSVNQNIRNFYICCLPREEKERGKGKRGIASRRRHSSKSHIFRACYTTGCIGPWWDRAMRNPRGSAGHVASILSASVVMRNI